jgi:hypothetical protein
MKCYNLLDISKFSFDKLRTSRYQVRSGHPNYVGTPTNPHPLLISSYILIEIGKEKKNTCRGLGRTPTK